MQVATQTPELLETPEEAREPNPNQSHIDGLRGLADFMERHPQAYPGDIKVYVYCSDKESLVKAIRGAGKVEKRVDDRTFDCLKRFSNTVSMKWFVARDKVCQKVVVGTKVVPAEPERIIPATSEQVIPAQPERVEEITEWHCPESLLQPV